MSLEIKVAIVFIVLLTIGFIVGARFTKSNYMGVTIKGKKCILKTPNKISFFEFMNMLDASVEDDLNLSVRIDDEDNIVFFDTRESNLENVHPLALISKHKISYINTSIFKQEALTIGRTLLLPWVVDAYVDYDLNELLKTGKECESNE